MSASADRNLLFGILALQMDFIRRDDLIAGMNAWVLDKSKPLGDILVEQKTLVVEDRAALDVLIERHLCRHGGDADKSLAALQMSTPLRAPLQQIPDADVQASLAHLAATPERAADPEHTTAYTAPTPGERFVVLRPHARGGLGQVSVALDQELHRQVALKEMLDQQAHDPDKRARFVREAEITGGLEHPGIVPVYGLGAYADGRPYYAMRFIKGDSLQQAIRQFHRQDTPDRDPGARTLALRQLLGRFVDVCNAVAYAHSRGVLHRDLKPQNVMLGPYGETLVVDWGLGKATGGVAEKPAPDTEPVLQPVSDSEVAATLAGSALGTPAYMSPEQASGRLDLLSPASDVYSLGATLYCLLTGQPPFDSGEVPAVLQAVQQGQWTPADQVKAGVPAALAAVCGKAMALEPEQRYASARALADDVEHWLADEPVGAYPEPLRQRAGRCVRRHKPMVTTAAALATVLLTAGAAWWQVAQQRQRADEKEQLATRAQAAESLMRHYRYDAEMQGAQQAWEAGDDYSHMRLVLDSQRSPPDREDLRGFEWYYLWHLAHQDLLTFGGHQNIVNSVSFSPDGRRLATASDTVKVWDSWTGKELLTVKGFWSVCFSPNGHRLATGSGNNTAKVWDAQTGKELLTLKGHQGPITSVCFSPDGRRLASASEDMTGKVWDTQTGKILLTLKGHHGSVSSVSFSPDGRRLATGSGDNTAKVWDRQTGKELLTLRGHAGFVHSVSFSPDGRRLATGSGDNTAKVWDAQTGKEVLSLRGHHSFVMSVSFSPDGRRLATGSADNTAKVWNAQMCTTVLILKGHQGPVTSVSFSPNGRHLATASADGTAKIWAAATGKEVLSLRGHQGQVTSVSYSPDGRRLATGSGDGTAKVWDADTGKELLTLRGHQGFVTSVSYSPDSRHLATGSEDNTARVWDVATGKEVLSLRGHQGRITNVSYSPDGRRLATGSEDTTAIVWDAQTGKAVLGLRDLGAVWSLSFSPDGNRLATGSADRRAEVWDDQTGKNLLLPLAHQGWVHSVGFSPDGNRLVTGSADKTAKVWDAQTGKEVLTLRGHRSAVFSVSFSPNGRRLATGSEDGTARVWTTVRLSAAEELEAEAAALVGELFAGPLCKAEVLARLKADPLLSPELRREALAQAQQRQDNPHALKGASSAVVRLPGNSWEKYWQALLGAEKAARLAPDDGLTLNTLGVAQYRVGQFDKALRTLTHSEQLNRTGKSGPQPADLAFLGLVHHRLGHQQVAADFYRRLRQVATQPRWVNDAETKSFLREVETMLKEKSAPPARPARAVSPEKNTR